MISVEEDRWVRHDLCEKCWREIAADGAPASARSYWQTKIPVKPEEADLPKRKEERALALLRKALEADTPADRRESFILALYLARKKFLHYRQEIDQLGETIILYEVSATEELLPVRKISLHPNDIEIVQKRLADMLHVL